MRKFQEWQDNQTYFTHLSNLNVIRCRKPPGTSKGRRRLIKQNRSLSQQQICKANQRMIKRIENPKRIAICNTVDYYKPTFSKQKYRVYEKNLNYENLLFGKRILQAQPVISTSKLKKEYDNRKFNRSLKSANSSWHMRSVKLFQYINSQQSWVCPKGNGKHILKLRIQKYEFHKLKIKDDDLHHISIIAQFGRVMKRSDLVPIKDLGSKNFCFRFRKNYCMDGDVRAYIRYHNGILDTELGYFDFSIKYYLDGQGKDQEVEANVYKKVGAYAGEVHFKLEAFKMSEQH